MDKAALEELLSDFYTVTKMEISVLDDNMHTLSEAKRPSKSLCADIHNKPGAMRICKGSDIEALSRVNEDKKPYVYTCPFGITEAVVPIIREDKVIGYVFSAMGIREGEDTQNVGEFSVLTDEDISARVSIMRLLAEKVSRDDGLIAHPDSIGSLTKQYIRCNLAKKITLADIALYLHCSTVSVTEHFKREFGITVMEYLVKKRMEASEELLLAIDAPLREIGERVGFSDVEYFSRTFKRYHGISPAAWKRLAKAENKLK